jgi:hypothetical protein
VLRIEAHFGKIAARLTRRAIAHEYLIQEISRWVDLEDLEAKQAQEQLEREVANWRVHRTLIPRDRLALLFAHWERLGRLNDEAGECIFRSALHSDLAVEKWVRVLGEAAETGLVAVLSDPSAETRQRAVKALGEIGSKRELESLIAALQDEDIKVRVEAGRGLAELGDPRPGVGVDPETGLPDIVWCPVPAGPSGL